MPCLRIGPDYGSRRVCGVSLYSDRRLPQKEKSVRVRSDERIQLIQVLAMVQLPDLGDVDLLLAEDLTDVADDVASGPARRSVRRRPAFRSSSGRTERTSGTMLSAGRKGSSPERATNSCTSPRTATAVAPPPAPASPWPPAPHHRRRGHPPWRVQWDEDVTGGLRGDDCPLTDILPVLARRDRGEAAATTGAQTRTGCGYRFLAETSARLYSHPVLRCPATYDGSALSSYFQTKPTPARALTDSPPVAVATPALTNMLRSAPRRALSPSAIACLPP